MTNNKQQTAVEWLVEQFTFKTIGGVYTTDGTDDVTNLVEHAKEMDKERIKKVWDDGVISATYGKPITFEQYYKQTYGDDKQ